MCPNYLWWELGLSGKPWAFRENECAKGTTGEKQGFCGNSVCCRDSEEILAFWGENRAFGKMSAEKGHFGENWAVNVLTGLIRKTSVPKGLKVEIRSFV